MIEKLYENGVMVRAIDGTIFQVGTRPPDEYEIMDKINEIIDYINNKEAQQGMARWIIQDTSWWRETPAGPVQVNRANLKCSACGYRDHKNEFHDRCPSCNERMEMEL